MTPLHAVLTLRLRERSYVQQQEKLPKTMARVEWDVGEFKGDLLS